MIWGSRRSAIESLRASVDTAFVLDVQHRFHSYRLEGVIDDSLLHRPVFPAENLEERPAISILLQGRMLVRAGDVRRWVEPGEGYVMQAHSSSGWRILGGCHGLTFAWEGPPATATPFFRITERERAALIDATARMHAGARIEAAAGVHQAAIDALQAIGLLPDAAFTKTPCDPARQALSMAIDTRLSNLAEEPMHIELQEELEISERTLRRTIAEMFKRYGFVDTNWGEARGRRRLMAAVAFMSNPAATTSLVAQAVGYHSTQAMARAFTRAGFPAPAKIRVALRELETR